MKKVTKFTVKFLEMLIKYILKPILRKKSNFEIKIAWLGYSQILANTECNIEKEIKKLHKPVLLHEVLSYLVKETPNFKVYSALE